MGWFLSPMVFQDIVTFVLTQCTLLTEVHIRHQQDDILIIGENLEHVKNAMDILIDHFASFGFIIKREKCEGPGDTVVYCGFKLFGDGAVKPNPVKRPLNKIAASTAAQLFERSKTVAETKHVLRSWLGTANYFNKWLPADLRSENLCLHTFLQKLEVGEVSRKEVADRAVDFIQSLCNWWLTSSYGLYGGTSDHEDTIVVTDSNVSGWSGCIFRLVEMTNPETDRVLPFSLSGILSNQENNLFPRDKCPENFTMLPVRFDGGRWDSALERSQSSTWRERAAAMLIIHRNREVLTGKVFILSDNKNLVNSWKDTETLTSSLSSAFQTYISYVHGALHVKRNHTIIQWVDCSARNLSALVSKRVIFTDQSFEPKRQKIEEDEVSVSSESSISESNISSEPEIPQNFTPSDQTMIGRHKYSDVSYLIENKFVTIDGDNLYTTSLMPGKVAVNSFVVPSQDSLGVLRKIHTDYGHPTISGMRKILNIWKLWVLNFKQIASTVVAGCHECLICRDTYHPKRSSLPMPKRPMEMIMADFLQPEKLTQPGFVIFRDRFSGFTEGRAIEKLDSP